MSQQRFIYAIIIVACFLSRCSSQQCDLTKGCSPAIFNILDQIDNFPARTVVVSSTCGSNGAGTSYQNLILSDSTTYTCVPASVSASNMVDNEPKDGPATFWLSDTIIAADLSRKGDQSVEFRFTDEFLFYEIQVKFAVPHGAKESDSAEARPAAWTIEKLTKEGTWTPLHHFAKNCATSFPGVPLLSGSPTTTVKCFQYEELDNGFLDEINWSEYYPGVMDVFGSLYKNDPAIASYFTTSGIRLLFKEPAVSLLPLASYVSIGTVVLKVACKCNGHASTCSGQNQATCDCQHFTAGQQCDQCLPLYNNRLPMTGTSTNAGECQVCDCNKHATSCHFDQAKGKGMCDACQDNTAGDSCNECATGFYVNPAWNPATSSVGNFCPGCQCNQAGTVASALSVCASDGGQCACKTNAMLRDCSECKDGFFGLAADKAEGCTACACNPDGTLGEGTLCDKGSGACLCRPNVQGDRCDACKTLTYGFNRDNPDGCTLCNCDPGASTVLTCDVGNGQCTCRSNIGGTDCRQPNAGFFVPKMDLMRIEPEFFTENVDLRPGHGTKDVEVSGRGLVPLTASVTDFQMQVTSTYSGLMDVVIQYEKDGSFIMVGGSLALTGTGYLCNGQTVEDNKSWTFNSPISSPGETRGAIVLTSVCLNKGSSYTMSLLNPGSKYSADSIVFIPNLESMKTAVSGRIETAEVERCRTEAISKLPQYRESCSQTEYSVMAALLGGATACQCSSGSLKDASCDPMSGDCNCRDGVLPPKCDHCKTEFYSYSAATGCIACVCHAKGSKNQYCSEAGVCDCLDNVIGNKCDACKDEYYGLSTGQGCQICQCNSMYSLNNKCDDNGQCRCKSGVDGQACDKCQDSHYNLTPDGCQACQCEPNGSTEKSCNQVTGECECLANVEGHSCDSCKNGFFGLGKWHPGGCIPCFCWDKGINCTSLASYTSKPIMSGEGGDNFNGWMAVKMDGSDVTVTRSAKVVNGQTQYSLTISPLQVTDQNQYFKAPSSFHGDKSSGYGRQLRMMMSPSSPQPGTTVTVKVILQGQFLDKPIVSTHNVDTALASQTYQIPIREGSWMKMITETTTEALTFKEMMAVLTGVSSLKIQAFDVKIPGFWLDLDSVSLDNAEQVQGEAINNLENCNCQDGYTGNHCERCADGYTRDDPNSNHPNDQCKLCYCNRHEQGPCDPVTGTCTCIHNTEGANCEICKAGYYGNATRGSPDDCLPCGCPGNVPVQEKNVFAQTCALNDKDYPVCANCQQGYEGDHCQLCANGYFGTPENVSNADGTCKPCMCNNRADTCDTRTGECISCRNNTTGQSCEICGPGFFGDANGAGCTECVCKNLDGATGQCDPNNGRCECLPNVDEFQCDQCVAGTFNLVKGRGCEPCNCFETGSTSLECLKDSGQCPCRPLVQGRQCNECQSGYWNINQANGCDACACNALGTAKNGDVTIASCDLQSGQCLCASPSIIGRQCDACSPVTTYKFQYVRLFYLGVFPQCQLCGECFDSWGVIIDGIGTELNGLHSVSSQIWSKYDNQTADTIATALNTTRDNIINADDSVERFRQIAQDLQSLTDNYTQAIAQNDRIDVKTGLLSQTKQNLMTNLAAVEALSELIQLVSGTSTTLSSLQSQATQLATDVEDAVKRGNSLWKQIESLAFVVARPEDRERQLMQQAEKSMAVATRANTTYYLAKLLYETPLKPGVVNSAQELTSSKAKVEEARRIYQTIQAIGMSVAENTTAIAKAVGTMASESATARARMLQNVGDLQEYLLNATVSQIKLAEVEKMADDLMKVVKEAEDTVRASTKSILENIAALNQANADMITAQSKATIVSNKQFRSTTDLRTILDAIDKITVSSTDVAALNSKAQEALFQAKEALTETEQALGMAREVKQEVELMEESVKKAQEFRVQAQAVRSEAIAVADSIKAIIDKAQTHLNKTQTDIASLTSSTQSAQDDITQVSTCVTEVKVLVDGVKDSTEGTEDRAQTVTAAQQTLLKVVLDINTEASGQNSGSTLNTMKTAKSNLDQLLAEAGDVVNITDIAALLQELTAQTDQIKSLENEIDQLTSEADTLLMALESVGTSSCASNPAP